jgi:hypothetical protein
VQVEAIFGIKMEPANFRGGLQQMPIGRLVYSVWSHLYKACVELELIRWGGAAMQLFVSRWMKNAGSQSAGEVQDSASTPHMCQLCNG